MNAESIKQRTFAILWDETEKPSYYDVGVVREWLKDEGWPLLFPGHCFTCHMSESYSCKPAEHLSCPACWWTRHSMTPAWTHGGSRTDCQGGPCGCPEAAHE